MLRLHRTPPTTGNYDYINHVLGVELPWVVSKHDEGGHEHFLGPRSPHSLDNNQVLGPT